MDKYQVLAQLKKKEAKLRQTWYSLEPPPDSTAIGLDATGTAGSVVTAAELHKWGVHPLANLLLSFAAYKGGKRLTASNKADYANKANALNAKRNRELATTWKQIQQVQQIIANEEKAQRDAKKRAKIADYKDLKEKQEEVEEEEKGFIIRGPEQIRNMKSLKHLLTDKWEQLFGYLQQQKFSCMIHGEPKAGKSHFCLQLAQYLEELFGDLLYVSGEEGMEETFRDKYKRWNCSFHCLEEVKGFQAILKAIEIKKPKFLFLDSLTRLGLTVKEIIYLKKHYPEIGVFFILHSNKDGNFKGNQSIKHEVSSVVHVVGGYAYQVGRMIEGETVMPVFPDLEEL